jgi:AraC-like DNA-binding protein
MRPQEISFASILQELNYLHIRQAQPEGKQPLQEFAHAQIGQLRIQSHYIPGIHVSSLQWQVGQHGLCFEDLTQSEDININLQLRGHLHTKFNCLANTLDMLPCHHNLIRTSEPGGRHTVKPGDFLDFFHLSLKPDRLQHYLDPNEALGGSLLQKLDKKEPFAASPQPLSISPGMQAIVADMRHCSLQGHTRKLYLEAKVSELLCLLLDAYSSFSLPINKLPKTADVEKLYALREYLHRYYLQPDLSLAGLCREFGLNEFVLKKGFKQLFDTTVFGYIQRLRMEHARLLMLEGGLTVAEAADALGYANPQHFSSAFKKLWGDSPGRLVKAKK